MNSESSIKFNVIIVGCIILFSIMAGMATIIQPAAVLFFLAMILAILFFIKRQEYIVISLIIINENLLYFIDPQVLFPQIYDLSLLLGIISVVLFLFFIKDILENRFLFGYEIIMLIVVFIISAINSYLSYDQKVTSSLYILMSYFNYLAYFYFSLVMKEDNNDEKITRFMIITGTVLGMLILLQFFLYGRVQFLSTFADFRYGSIRIRSGAALLLLTTLITINSALDTKKRRVLKLICSGIQAFVVLFVSKGRLEAIALIMAVLLLFYLHKNISRFYFVSALVLAACGGICLVLFKWPNLIDVLFKEEIRGGGSLGARIDEMKFFINGLKDNFIFGKGILNIAFDEQYIVSGLKYGYYAVDLGIIGFTYYFGIVGGALLVILLFKAFLRSIDLYKLNSTNIFPMVYILMNIFTLPMICNMNNSTSILIVIFVLSYIDSSYRKIQLRKDNK